MNCPKDICQISAKSLRVIPSKDFFFRQCKNTSKTIRRKIKKKLPTKYLQIIKTNILKPRNTNTDYGVLKNMLSLLLHIIETTYNQHCINK